MRELFETEAKEIIAFARKARAEHRKDASGETSRSFRYVVTETGFTIFAKGNVEQDEVGRSFGKMPPTLPLQLWIQTKGITGKDGKPLSAFALAKSIAKKGTLLFQGRDPRFAGRRNSGLLGDLITQERINLLSQKLAGQELQKVTSEVLETWK